jgi:ABC-type transporter Mla subunit MlaD
VGVGSYASRPMAKVTPTAQRLLALEMEVRELRLSVRELAADVRGLTAAVRELLVSVKDVTTAVANHEGRLRALETAGEA